MGIDKENIKMNKVAFVLGRSASAEYLECVKLVPGHSDTIQVSNQYQINKINEFTKSRIAFNELVPLQVTSSSNSPKHLGCSLYDRPISMPVLYEYSGLSVTYTRPLLLTRIPAESFHLYDHERNYGATFTSRSGYVDSQVNGFYDLACDRFSEQYSKSEHVKFNTSLAKRIKAISHERWSSNELYPSNVNVAIKYLLTDIKLYIEKCMDKGIDHNAHPLLEAVYDDFIDDGLPLYLNGKFPIVYDACVKYGINITEFSLMFGFLFLGKDIIDDSIDADWSLLDILKDIGYGDSLIHAIYICDTDFGEVVDGSGTDSGKVTVTVTVDDLIADIGNSFLFGHKTNNKSFLDIEADAIINKILNFIKGNDRLVELAISSGIVTSIDMLNVDTELPDWFMFELVAELPSNVSLITNSDPKIKLGSGFEDEYVDPGVFGTKSLINAMISKSFGFTNSNHYSYSNSEYYDRTGSTILSAISLSLLPKYKTGSGNPFTSSSYISYGGVIEYVAQVTGSIKSKFGSNSSSVIGYIDSVLRSCGSDNTGIASIHSGFVEAIKNDTNSDNLLIATNLRVPTIMVNIDNIAAVLATMESVKEVTIHKFGVEVEFVDETFPVLLNI